MIRYDGEEASLRNCSAKVFSALLDVWLHLLVLLKEHDINAGQNEGEETQVTQYIQLNLAFGCCSTFQKARRMLRFRRAVGPVKCSHIYSSCDSQ